MVARRLRAKVTKLDAYALEIILILRNYPQGLTVPEIGKRLVKFRQNGIRWRPSMRGIIDRPQALGNATTNDGTVRALVVEGNGKWRASGI